MFNPAGDTSVPGLTTVRQLGSGANGRCYLMRTDGGDGAEMVQKRVPVGHMAPADQEVAEREVNILAALSHPHIIRYERAFVREGKLCILMEHAAGGDLAQHVKTLREAGSRVLSAQALDWFVQLLLALKYVHAHKVLHRDIALKNVFLAADNSIKLGDFGVARVLANTSELASTKVGTPCCISPERCEGKPYSYESDVWSLGCLLYELLTGRPAFAAESIPQVTRQILDGAYAPVQPADEVPTEAAELVARILQVDPTERPTLDGLLATPLLQPHLARHDAVAGSFATLPPGCAVVGAVDIPLIGYEGASKTKFSERPVFVEGGGRIIEEGAPLSDHDAKLLGARNRRARQVADKRGGSGSGPAASSLGLGSGGSSVAAAGGGGSGAASPANKSGLNFEKAINFGEGGVIGFIQKGAAKGGGGGGEPGAT